MIIVFLLWPKFIGGFVPISTSITYTAPRPFSNSPYAIRRQAGGKLEFDEKGQQVVDQLSKTNRQRVVDEIRQQPADELEMLSEFGAIAIKSIFLQSKTKQNALNKKQTTLLPQIPQLHLCAYIVNAWCPIGIVCPAEACFANWDFKLSTI